MKSFSNKLLSLVLGFHLLVSVLHAASPIGTYPHVPPVQGWAAGLSVSNFQINYTAAAGGTENGVGPTELSAFVEKKDVLRAEFGYVPSRYVSLHEHEYYDNDVWNSDITIGVVNITPPISVSLSGSLPSFYGHDFWLGVQLIRANIGDGEKFMINQYAPFLEMDHELTDKFSCFAKIVPAVYIRGHIVTGLGFSSIGFRYRFTQF